MEALIHQYVGSWNSGKISELSAVFHSSATYSDPMQAGNAIDVLSGSIQHTHNQFRNVSFQINRIVATATAQLYVLEWTMKAYFPEPEAGEVMNDKQLSIEGADLIQIKAEKIETLKSYYDTSSFM